MNIQQLGKEVGADSLEYLSEEDLVEAIGLGESAVCTACFSGKYLEEGGDVQDVTL